MVADIFEVFEPHSNLFLATLLRTIAYTNTQWGSEVN